jgi:hypothetical protein
MLRIIDAQFEGKNLLSFISHSVQVANYEVFIIMQFDKDTYEAHHQFNRDSVEINKIRKMTIYRSLADSLTAVILNFAADQLYKPDPGIGLQVIEADSHEILRIAGAAFIGRIIAATSNFEGGYGIYEICNRLSALKNEGEVAYGKMIISSSDHPNVQVMMKLKHPVALRLENNRIVRKLLEISTGDLSLCTDGTNVVGFGRILGEYDGAREDLFTISFLGEQTWDLAHNNKAAMIVKSSIPSLPAERIDKEEFYIDTPTDIPHSNPREY